MEPWQSWAIVGAAGAGAYWYYARSKNNNRTRGRTSSLLSQAQRKTSEMREESSKRRKKGKNTASSDRRTSDAADGSSQSVPTSGNEKTKKRKGVKKQPSQLGQTLPTNVDKKPAVDVEPEGPEDDGMDNKEFAKQLSSLRAGTSLAKPTGAPETKKTKKQGKRNEALLAPSNDKIAEPATGSSHEMSTTSSTTGADADDDLSPATSPAFGPTESAKNAGDVSDMLEAPTRGPSVLRLTQPTQPQPERQPKQKKSEPEPETKKQRQNRQKNEVKKAAREEAEKERRVLLEKQRRTAREAEGRAAKNGLGTSKPPTTSAWDKPTEGNTASTKPTAANITSSGPLPLLDTFDETAQPVGTVTKTEANGTTAAQKAWDRDMPSEEEQMKMLNELDDDGWNTVQKGGKAKRKTTAPASNQISDLEGAKAEPTTPEGSSNGHTNGYVNEKKDRNVVSNGGMNGGSKTTSGHDVGPLKSRTPHDKLDPKIWNRSNIHNHPDYDPEFPYALTGHPDDSDWAVV